ncbi:MAG: 3-hydroxyacyl-ACP dehydratase FabZ [Candidatus Omnitrophica bacterium]|nr:3-hydroxyacyl-ACP dehydratase FabZ [Candidatus Omnitrophota bacterium]
MQLNVMEIQKVIPHRFPFLMIDRVIELIPNEKLVAIKNVTVNEHQFVGHFPNEKVMPGVLMIEAMAQAGCVYFHYSKNPEQKELIYYLAKTEAKFHSVVVPGDQLRIEITPVKLIARAGFIQAKAYVGDKLAVEAQIGFGIKEVSK